MGWPAQATIAWEAKAAHRQIMLSVWPKPYVLPDSLRFTVTLSRKVKKNKQGLSPETHQQWSIYRKPLAPPSTELILNNRK